MRPGVLALAVAGALAACAPRPEPPAGPRIVLNPPVPAAQPRLAPVTPAVVAIRRDSRALHQQAARYVARKDSDPEIINQLSPLTLQMRRAIERMDRDRGRLGYRPDDVIAARVAADALAAFLATQARTRTPPPDVAPESPAAGPQPLFVPSAAPRPKADTPAVPDPTPPPPAADKDKPGGGS